MVVYNYAVLFGDYIIQPFLFVQYFETLFMLITDYLGAAVL